VVDIQRECRQTSGAFPLRDESSVRAMKGIVVVDEDPIDYAEMLRLDNPSGVELSLYLFRSGRSALRVLPVLGVQTLPITLCLINTRLPDMTGFDLLQMLQPALSDSRGVLVGSRYRLEDEKAARQCGAAFYICKPLQKSWFDRIGSSEMNDDLRTRTVLTGHGEPS